MARSKSIKNHCYNCGDPVTGNVRPEEEVGVICGRCAAGQAEYVKNHPDEYPVPVAPKKKRGMRIKDSLKGKTLSDC
jgi:hypothetical protein